jgi:hypothetical protein
MRLFEHAMGRHLAASVRQIDAGASATKPPGGGRMRAGETISDRNQATLLAIDLDEP